MTTHAAAAQAIADVFDFTAAEANVGRRELEQLFLSAGGSSADQETQAAALMQVRGQLGLDDRLLRLSSDISAADRMELAKKGWALPDGSYPIPDAAHLQAAAILCKSKHGDWQAAAKLIARRSKELGVPNPLVPAAGASHNTGSQHVAASAQERHLARAGLAPDDILLSNTSGYDGSCTVGLTQEEADNEVADILNRVSAAPGNKSMRFDLSAAYAGRSRAARPVQLAAREYDDDVQLSRRSREDDAAELDLTAEAAASEIARLTASNPGAARYFRDAGGASRRHHASGEDRGAEIQREIIRLTNGDSRFVGLAGVPDFSDVSEPTVSDTSQGIDLPDQTTSFGQLSDRAAQELAGMVPTYQSVIQDALDDAVASLGDGDYANAAACYSEAASLARRKGAGRLASELSQRASQARLRASTLVTPAEAQRQVAGGTDVAAEIERLSSLAIKGSFGNRSDPPKSAAVRVAESRAARPRHT